MAVSYKSDYIRPTGKGGGRPFDTHGARFDNGMVFVNEGLSHEENPNGGVQVGVDGNGKPNLVEQGEVIVDLGGGPYVMSQRLRLGREDLLMAGLPVKYAGKTCAEAATGMQRESEERPLDEISMRGLRAMLERLAAVQETYRDDIGASGTQNLNLGQDLYGARAQAVGNEEEMGQTPIESEAEEGYAAYGGWSLKKKDMPPYGYYNYGSIPEYGYAPRYDGFQNIPPQYTGFTNGAMVDPYVGVPAAPRYPAAYPYPIAPVRRQMAYGGYRFAGPDPTDPQTNNVPERVTLENGATLLFYPDGSVKTVDKRGNIRESQNEEITAALDKLDANSQYVQDILSGRSKNPAPMYDWSSKFDEDAVDYYNSDQTRDTSLSREKSKNGNEKSTEYGNKKENHSEGQDVHDYNYNAGNLNASTIGNFITYDQFGNPIYGEPQTISRVVVNSPGTISGGVNYTQQAPPPPANKKAYGGYGRRW